MKKQLLLVSALFIGVAMLLGTAVHAADRPNILVIWGDDIGHDNVSAYHRGMMGADTPNIDRIANEGALMTDAYAQQSCTAGRASFMLGQNPFRTGLLTIGMPGAKHGVRKIDPTIAELLKPYGYKTGQFGKNHLGDRNEYLPTVHGFDEFYGNLYHLNAEEEPENVDYPEKSFAGDGGFRAEFGPRGVLDCVATDKSDKTDEPRWGVVGKQKCEDTGPLTKKRMETIEEDLLNRSLDFMDRAVKEDKPFFLWHVSTRNHVWIRLSEKYKNKTGYGVFADGMAELDDVTGALLDKLDELGIADNTIVIWSTDNGAEKFTWPQGGNHAFKGEKGLTTEGGLRVPQLVRWPGKIKPGTIINDVFSHIDWMPTLLAAANGGEDTNIQARLKEGGVKADGKTFKAHLDGYNQLDLLTGKGPGKRKNLFYFDAEGDLNAVRLDHEGHAWKLTFTEMSGDLPTAWKKTPSWPIIRDLRQDPYEQFTRETAIGMGRWWADRMYLMVPAQQLVRGYLQSLEEFPPARGSSLSLGKLMDKIEQAEQ
jgi:arylsulfatase